MGGWHILCLRVAACMPLPLRSQVCNTILTQRRMLQPRDVVLQASISTPCLSYHDSQNRDASIVSGSHFAAVTPPQTRRQAFLGRASHENGQKGVTPSCDVGRAGWIKACHQGLLDGGSSN